MPKRYAYMVIVVQNNDKGGSDQATATNIHDKETVAALLRSIAQGLDDGAFLEEYEGRQA